VRDEQGKEHNVHTLPEVYGVMLLQICREYHNLPPYKDLTLSEIRYFYGGLRNELKSIAKLGKK
jgi:hypothetical protein